MPTTATTARPAGGSGSAPTATAVSAIPATPAPATHRARVAKDTGTPAPPTARLAKGTHPVLEHVQPACVGLSGIERRGCPWCGLDGGDGGGCVRAPRRGRRGEGFGTLQHPLSDAVGVDEVEAFVGGASAEEAAVLGRIHGVPP